MMRPAPRRLRWRKQTVEADLAAERATCLHVCGGAAAAAQGQASGTPASACISPPAGNGCQSQCAQPVHAGTINSKQSHLSCEAGRQLQKGSCQSGAQVDNLRIHQSPSHGAQCASVQYLDRLLQPTRNVQVAPAHEVIPQFLRLYHTVLEQRSIKLDKRVEVHTAANVLSDADDEVGPAAGGLCNPRVVRCVVAHVLHATWTWRVVRQQPLSMQHCTRPRRKPAVCMALLCITD
mmetsp:Transcript_31179/g.92992  ORF Transcript_31179/g.92992 Transcript_31179/m.92992 type:complete len:235 (-) Transcript_31179:627-1331(-)